MDDLFEGDGYSPDASVAKKLGKNRKTLKNWDNDPRMQGLGWPAPLILNRIKHRPHAGLRAFLRAAAAATLNKPA